MSKTAKPNDGGVLNISNARTAVQGSVKKIIELKAQRKRINDQIASERGLCKSAGVPPAALDLAIRMKEMDPEQRAAHDEGYLLARQAIGLAIQRDLFETLGGTDGDGEQISPEGQKAIDAAKAKGNAKPMGEALKDARNHIGDGEKKPAGLRAVPDATTPA
jgi:hypothetical protein